MVICVICGLEMIQMHACVCARVHWFMSGPVQAKLSETDGKGGVLVPARHSPCGAACWSCPAEGCWLRQTWTHCMGADQRDTSWRISTTHMGIVSQSLTSNIARMAFYPWQRGFPTSALMLYISLQNTLLRELQIYIYNDSGHTVYRGQTVAAVLLLCLHS